MTADPIKEHIIRAKSAMQMKPSAGQGDKSAKTSLVNGLSCVTREGPWTIRADMPQVVGGDEAAPNPGTLCRAAIGSCLVIGYSMWAKQLDVPIDSLDVTITTSYDDGGLLGANDDPPGYSKVVYRVCITSDASRDEIIKLLDMADKHSPLLDVFTRDQNCIRELDLRKV